ncbi:uracil-DNA glycosylase [Profundibacterium mesophilum]|uniref:Type-4 uracil-DNA glycosylase n=1 Tax=Profundibacterium mesophilum KAUST100406-0324 TaxID=1037889 RepID=A0A921TCQ9_9RHOB|nr:uracil-DNA glycosylase [Profundibacterium mesophilum]KAF0675973.1 uracil-DNA glycosylase [Profundibacterium mesophilum KAUST100406-0324]
MDPDLDHHAARALLEWQIELGASEAICEQPIDRYALDPAPPRADRAPADHAPAEQTGPAQAGRTGPAQAETRDPKAEACAAAEDAARLADDLDGLRAAMAAFEGCELKRGARNLVFADGRPGARVMIVGEAPGREEDQAGRPFVGKAGQLLDRMFAQIGLSRGAQQAHDALYITNVLPWRPPQNRDPNADEIAMMLPFLRRHVALADPEVLILMGNVSCQALLGRKGILRLRGGWTQALERPALPMTHPAYLLRMPAAKREAWSDLLALRAHLEGTPEP